jgi:hypothetical protein
MKTEKLVAYFKVVLCESQPSQNELLFKFPQNISTNVFPANYRGLLERNMLEIF